MNRTRAFFLLVGTPLVALALGAATLLLGALSGRRPMWQPTDANLVAAIQNQSPVAVKVFVETLPNVDSPVPFSHPRILNGRKLELTPFAIALLQGHEFMIEILGRAGSDPAKALAQMPPEIATALLDYARETHNTLAIEYLTKYRNDLPGAATTNRAPATR